MFTNMIIPAYRDLNMMRGTKIQRRDTLKTYARYLSKQKGHYPVNFYGMVSSLKYKHLRKMPLFGTNIGVVETTLPEDSSRL